jgi:nitroimidazol reductase NimA-like FMN-containing flavoprotein (pyridoxamine 5'-phosphate oxidase superfamily)
MSEGTQSESWRGKVGKMSEEQVAEFLATDVLCRLGCLDDEGWPYVVPIWFQYKDGGVYLIARERSVWADYLKRDPRCFLAMDETGAQRKVLMKGTAELVEDANVGGKWVAIAEEMSLRYLGPNGPKYLVPTLNEPRILFFVRPVKTTTWQGVDWATRYKHSTWGEAGASPAGGSDASSSGASDAAARE